MQKNDVPSVPTKLFMHHNESYLLITVHPMRSVFAYKIECKNIMFLQSNFFSIAVMVCNNTTKPSLVKKNNIFSVLHAIRSRELEYLSPQIM